MTIYDIARACNVSIATVSRVLNGSPKVSPKTREQVLAVMREENYIPNVFARGLGLNSMQMIGILCTDISDTFYAKAVSLVEHDLRGRGFDVLLACSGDELKDKNKYIDVLMEKRVDAIILIGSPFTELQGSDRLQAAAKLMPIVLINGLMNDPNVYCVLCDEKSAMQNNVELLYQSGHREILYLYDSLSYGGQQKLSGYVQGLKNCGLHPRESLTCHIPKTMDSAYAKTLELISSGVPFSAALAAEDLLAAGIQKAAAEKKIALPVIGFNNSIISICTTPSLTSVDNKIEQLCPTAVQLLIQVLAGESADKKIVVASELIERESFRALPINKADSDGVLTPPESDE